MEKSETARECEKMYLGLGVLFLIISLAMAGVITATLVLSLKDGDEFISKKNLLYIVPTFLILYFLHITAAAFNNAEMDFFYCLNLINTAMEVLKFKIQGSLLAPLCREYPIYYVNFALAFALSGVTVILSVSSFFGRRLRNFIFVRAFLRAGKDVVLGDSKDALKYAKNEKKCVLLCGEISRKRYADLLKSGYTVLKAEFDSKKFARKIRRGRHDIIVFRDGNFSYTKATDAYFGLNACGVDARLHLEANLEEMKILKEKFVSKAEKSASAYITGFSKYELMARKFAWDYPVTKFIPRDFFNPNFTIKTGKEINVVFIGFGKVNYQLFRTCATQFQFAVQDGERLAVKPVNYFVYDTRAAALNNEFFSRILYEFDEDFKDCDFPKPDKICSVIPRTMDINSVEAKREFKAFVNENSFTYFIISLDDDLRDASYAETVKRLLPVCGNYKIFVRAKNDNGEKLNDGGDGFIYFGEQKKLYTHENIVNDDLTALAQKLNLIYGDLSGASEWLKSVKELPVDKRGRALNEKLKDCGNRDEMVKRWAELPYIEQASNLYRALNIPFKLNLMGFAPAKKTDGLQAVTESEFYKTYANDGRADGYADYSFFFKTQPANTLAFMEHSRWNALYILYDFTQMKKADMKIKEEVLQDGTIRRTLPHKDLARKRHACITTYYGLDELICFKYKTLYPDAMSDGKNYKTDERLRELSKIYAYDYIDLDGLYNEIAALDYAIVKA